MMKDFKEFEKLIDINKPQLIELYKNEFNRLVKNFKDENDNNEEFGGELGRMAQISIMTSIHMSMILLQCYHSWLQNQQDQQD